ncbi:hypothetical protein BC937DRAFT_86886 [Endogone sp. FLAS-F59071]|nr:hypothetical protein BC937DRAFT_86886 [Endogone sp. FLAS-F59071]|eukprot:RUS12842.1 hypothetical protein BC937DRAFT_86886 [Endogone sp. FLAS-F59071]
MPSLEITSNVSRKDLDTFVKTLSATFTQDVGKPEETNRVSIKSMLIPPYILVSFVKGEDHVHWSIGGIGPTENKVMSKHVSEFLQSELNIASNRRVDYFLSAWLD